MNYLNEKPHVLSFSRKDNEINVISFVSLAND